LLRLIHPVDRITLERRQIEIESLLQPASGQAHMRRVGHVLAAMLSVFHNARPTDTMSTPAIFTEVLSDLLLWLIEAVCEDVRHGRVLESLTQGSPLNTAG
jgi:hypothetical protein